MKSDRPKVMIGEHRYSIGRIGAPEALKVSKRIAPLLRGLAGVDPKALLDEARDPAQRAASMERAVGALLGGLDSLTDENVDYILSTTLSAVERETGAGVAWSQVWLGKGLMFDDIDMKEMLQLVWCVLNENVLGFTQGLALTSPVAAPLN